MTGALPVNVLVTGASGFIGRRITDLLEGDPRWFAIPATRDRRAGSRWLELSDPASVAAALAGIGMVVHCAVGDRGITVDGTRALLAAARQAGVRRLVYFSSMSVYGGASGRVTEDTPLVAPTNDDYGGWKSAAEQACLAEPGVETVRLRPTIVYGAGSQQWVSWYAQRILSGRWGTFGPAGEGTCNLVHVSDVAAAAVAALATTTGAGQAFNVNGPDLPTWNEWFTRLSREIGGPTLAAFTPAALRGRRAAGLPLKVLARLGVGAARKRLMGVPGTGETSLFGLQAVYPIAAAANALPWSPAMSLAEGLADCGAWLRSIGLAR